IWDVDTGEQLQVLKGHDKRVWSAVFTPDGRRVFSGGDDGTARLWDAETGAELRRFAGHTQSINSVAVSPDGRYGLTGSWDGTIRLWNLKTGLDTRRFEDAPPCLPTAGSLSPAAPTKVSASGACRSSARPSRGERPA